MSSNGLPQKPHSPDSNFYWCKQDGNAHSSRGYFHSVAQQSSSHPPAALPMDARHIHRPNPVTSCVVYKREDAQPNEGSWVPYRFRRPAQPPTIRTSTDNTPESPMHVGVAGPGLQSNPHTRNRGTRPRREASLPSKGPSHAGSNFETSEPSDSRNTDHHPHEASQHHPYTSTRLRRVNLGPGKHSQYNPLQHRNAGTTVAPVTSPSIHIPHASGSKMSPWNPGGQPPRGPRAMICPSASRHDDFQSSPLDMSYNGENERISLFTKRRLHDPDSPIHASRESHQQRGSLPQERDTAASGKRPRYNPRSGPCFPNDSRRRIDEEVRRDPSSISFPARRQGRVDTVFVRATLRRGLNLETCVNMVRTILSVYGPMQVLCSLAIFFNIITMSER